jgi:hypothetical protein
MDASFFTQRMKSRAVLAAKLVNETRFAGGCSTYVTPGGIASDVNTSVQSYVYTTAADRAALVTANACTPPPPPPPPAATYYTVANNNDPDFVPAGPAFTIEWFQNLTPDSSPFPRVFSIGDYEGGNIQIAVSEEGGDGDRTLIFWINRTPYFIGTAGAIEGTTVHVAVVFDGTNINAYIGGVSIGSEPLTLPTMSPTTSQFALFNEAPPSDIAQFYGTITDFRWTNGTAIYTGPFTPPASPLPAVTGTVLLIPTMPTTSTTVYNDKVVAPVVL